MSNLRQSHHQIGVEVDASTSALQTAACPSGSSMWENASKIQRTVLFPRWIGGEKCIDISCMCVLEIDIEYKAL